MSLPNELVYRIIDSLSDDPNDILAKYTLVSKSWLHYIRHRSFNDFTIQLCKFHQHPKRCRSTCTRCITQFATLVRSKYTTIPRTVRTLQLRGENYDIQRGWQNMWRLIPNAGGMENARTVGTVMAHFKSVDHLKLVKVYWFTPSWRSSRAVARLLSTTTSLTLNEVSFLAGPSLFFRMLDEAPGLRMLSIDTVTWPSLSGLPNDPPWLYVASYQLIYYNPFIFIPIFHLSKSLVKIREAMSPPKQYELRQILHEFDMDISDIEESTSIRFAQKNMIGEVTSARINIMCMLEKSKVQLCQTFLDTMQLLNHLSIHTTGIGFRDTPALPPPTLTHLTMLESLSIHLDTQLCNPCHWISWLHEILRTAAPALLHTIHISVKDMIVAEYRYDAIFQDGGTDTLQDSSFGLDEVDRYVADLPSLRRLEVCATIGGGWKRGGDEVCEIKMEKWMRAAFRRCDASCVLDLSVSTIKRDPRS